MKLKEKLISLLKPKIQKSEDIFESAKYLMIYRMMVFLSMALFFLFIVLISFYDRYFGISTGLGLLASVSALVYIRKTGEYKKFIISFNLFGALLCVATLFLFNEMIHIVDGLWMVISCIFTFLTVGIRLGLAIGLVHAISLSIFYGLFINEQIALYKDLNQIQIFSTIMNILICFFIIFYLNWQNIRMTTDARNQLKTAGESLQQQFDLIYKQNEEKSVLLKEIHHRVKNNLQVIISLLRLQSRDITDNKELSKFSESINRIVTMSMIHEKIYQNEELSKVNLEDYFKTLADHFLNANNFSHKISFNMSSEIKFLDLKPTVPLALIFNELFTNSVKYAFAPDQDARIDLRFISGGEETYEMIYCDNGTWKEPLIKESFGLELIDALTEQLNGSYDRQIINGTKYHFYFEKLIA